MVISMVYFFVECDVPNNLPENGELFGALEDAARTLGRPVNPTLYTLADWARRVRGDNAFITRVGQQPKIWLVGSEEQLNAPGT